MDERLSYIYMNEWYIHQHHNFNDQNLNDPSDDKDVQVGKSQHKGNIYCFVAAIQGPDPKMDNPGINAEKAGLAPSRFGHSV
jgi:hypothetical protein